jgi:hypothetical protein
VSRSLAQLERSGLLRAGAVQTGALLTLLGAVRMVFPAELGRRTRGLATAADGPATADRLVGEERTVWPDDGGAEVGTSLAPLHPCVVQASRRDAAFYEVISLVELIRSKEAVLLEKLKVFGEEITWRNRIAARYNEGLRPHVAKVPDVPAGNVSNWAQYTIEHPGRDGLIAHLKAHDVPTAVYYPIPLHLQPAYERFPQGAGGLPVTERLKDVVVSLPMHSDLDEATQDRIIAAVAGYKG